MPTPAPVIWCEGEGMKRNAVIYSYPFLVDIVVALLLFVGRHSLASRGLPEGTVGSVLLCYGIGYCGASLFMRHVVRPRLARAQMAGSLAVIVGSCVALAQLEQVLAIQAMFCLVPIAISLFFNSFQSYMLGVTADTHRSLGAMAGHYTFSWSLGYALGPLVSGASRTYLEWVQVYYLAAVLAAAVAVPVALFKPHRPAAVVHEAPREPLRAAGRSLIGPAWLGVALGWVGWNAVSTYWPVQAIQADFPAVVKGGVEFAFAVAQSLGALALIWMGAWHHRPLALPLLGAVGVGGLLVFGSAAAPVAFVAGAALLGLYTSSAFSFMVYHSMFDADRAVQRVAYNETVVGLSFLVGPVLAAGLHHNEGPFGTSYVALAGLLAAGLTVQTLWARAAHRRGADAG